ncbi:MAG: hypothetical protein IPF38_13345 [Burkholderiales bacterium]|nr:hypothetical protein [Burkholderiales bacterium]
MQDADYLRQNQKALAEPRAAIPFKDIQAPFDVFPFEFGLAYASGLELATRPAFQTYYATSRRMTEHNANFLASKKVPKSVLFSMIAVDNRYPALEDPQTLRAYRRFYQVGRQTPDQLLLTRRTTPLRESQSCQPTFELGFGQTLTLPPLQDGSALWARIAVESTWLGRLAGFLLGPPALGLSVVAPNWQRDFRFLREAGESGFLLSPALVSTPAAAHFLSGAATVPEDRITNIKLPALISSFPWFDNTFDVTLCTLAWAPP